MPGKKKKTFCGSLFDVEERIRAETNIQNIKYVVLSIGVNDVETKSAEQVMQQLEVVVVAERETRTTQYCHRGADPTKRPEGCGGKEMQ